MLFRVAKLTNQRFPPPNLTASALKIFSPSQLMWMSLWPLLLLFARSATAKCPVDLTYVSTFPWDDSSCLPADNNQTACCLTLLSVYGIGLGQRLHDTGLFNLPDEPTSAACLIDFQGNLSAAPHFLPSSLVLSCFSPDRFVISANFCAGIFSTADWVAKLGNSIDLDAACRGDLTDRGRCNLCVKAGLNVTSTLTAIDGNTSSAIPCFYLTVLYAASVVNQFGPKDPRAAMCIMGLALSSPSPAEHNSSSSHSAAIYASVAVALALFSAASLLLWRSSRNKKRKKKNESAVSERSPRSYPRPNTGSIWFDVKELDEATAGFSQRNLIGRGGFGVIYRGTLADGSLVAVKKMLELAVDDGDEEFRNEVEIISHLRHRNLVPLRGCCIAEEGKQMYLVYDYMPNGNLNDHIFISGTNSSGDGSSGSEPRRTPLTWPQRKNIILDVAKGLLYLHYGVKPAIYHRDVKATNILLDAEMSARLADFGLARQSREGQSHVTTRVAGTHGYLAPEYALYGQLTEKSDVYSFGVLVLETMSGRRALDMGATSNLVLITDWAWTLIKAKRAEEVLDPALRSEEGPAYPKGIMERFVLVGVLCAHVMVALRPTILEALKMLEGDIEVPQIPDRPMPVAHGLIFGDGDTFAASPASIGPSVNTGDMHR